MLCKKEVLGNFAKFAGKLVCQSLFFNVADLRSAISFKERLFHRCFPVNLRKNTFSYRTPPVAASLFRIISRVTLLYLTGFWIRLRKHYNFLFSIPSITKMFRFKIFVSHLTLIATAFLELSCCMRESYLAPIQLSIQNFVQG